MAGSLAGVKSISVSYGHFQKLPKEIIEAESRLPSSGTTSTSTSTSTLSSTSKERTTSSIQTSGHLPASNEATTSLSMKANLISAKLVEKLYREWEEEVDCYAINVPLCRTLEQPEIIYTRMWDSKYGRVSMGKVHLNLKKHVKRSSFFYSRSKPFGCFLLNLFLSSITTPSSH